MQEVERLVTRLHPHVRLPGQLRLAAHDVAPREPAQVAELRAVLLVLNLQQSLLGLLVVRGRRAGNTVVPVEVVIVGEVRLDGLEVHEHILELAQEEEAGGHALPSRDGVALRGGGAHELEELLRHLQMLARARLLAQRGEDHALEDVLPGDRRLQVLDEVERLHGLVRAKVVDDQIQPSLRNDVEQGRQHLDGILAVAEDDQVVLQQVVLLEDVATIGCLLQHLQLGLRSLPVVQLVVAARLQVDGRDRVGVVGEVGP
mmetsp:Transcript_15480/g.46477  ORF Transcript_15480/g.46477 Transcript_15480/m.46477 type:complete len:259 (+) Transcript_15480:434-1210(+)